MEIVEQRSEAIVRTPIHPGKHLPEQLAEHGLSAAELSRQNLVPTSRLTHIVNGRRAVAPDAAPRLGHFFDTSAEFWLNLRQLRELRTAGSETGET
jgi:addiction module HigA family antidote